MTNMELMLNKVRTTLQDVDKVRWSDDELEKLIRIAAQNLDNATAVAYPESVDDHLWYAAVKMAKELKN